MPFARLRLLGCLLAWALALAVPAARGEPVHATLLDLQQVWNQSPHNAFPRLAYLRGQFYLVFREGSAHVSNDGTLRILVSPDARQWTSVATISMAGKDLREARITQMPDGRLAVHGAARDLVTSVNDTIASFSVDGVNFSPPQVVIPGRWLWSVVWRQGQAYGFSYGFQPYVDFRTSTDGIEWSVVASEPFGAAGGPNECALRFATDGTAYSLVRRSVAPDDTALSGWAKPPYTSWQASDLGIAFRTFGGPALVETFAGHWIGGGRQFTTGGPLPKQYFALTSPDVTEGTMEKLLYLRSGGDCSYPSFVWRQDVLFVAYYSTHLGTTAIYLARVGLRPATGNVTNPRFELPPIAAGTWMPQGGAHPPGWTFGDALVYDSYPFTNPNQLFSSYPDPSGVQFAAVATGQVLTQQLARRWVGGGSYRLDVDVGDPLAPAEWNTGGWAVELLAGNTVVARADDLTHGLPPEGGWLHVSHPVHLPPGDPAAGRPIRLRLLATGFAGFDNVRLRGPGLPRGASVPEGG